MRVHDDDSFTLVVTVFISFSCFLTKPVRHTRTVTIFVLTLNPILVPVPFQFSFRGSLRENSSRKIWLTRTDDVRYTFKGSLWFHPNYHKCSTRILKGFSIDENVTVLWMLHFKPTNRVDIVNSWRTIVSWYSDKYWLLICSTHTLTQIYEKEDFIEKIRTMTKVI